MTRSSQRALRTRSPARASAEGAMVLSELTPSTCNCRIDRPISCPASKSSISRGDWTEGTEPIVPQHGRCGSPLRQRAKPSSPGARHNHQRPHQALEMATSASRFRPHSLSRQITMPTAKDDQIAVPWLDNEVIDPPSAPVPRSAAVEFETGPRPGPAPRARPPRDRPTGESPAPSGIL